MQLARHKAKLTSLQEQVKVLEEATDSDNAERTRTLQELSAERGEDHARHPSAIVIHLLCDRTEQSFG